MRYYVCQCGVSYKAASPHFEKELGSVQIKIKKSLCPKCLQREIKITLPKIINSIGGRA